LQASACLPRYQLFFSPDNLLNGWAKQGLHSEELHRLCDFIILKKQAESWWMIPFFLVLQRLILYLNYKK
jgi:hypothetical protein